jgi:type IV pilus assembly protein PilK
MNVALAPRSPNIQSDQLTMLMQQLHSHAGIKINSSQGVVAGCIGQRMTCLGMSDVDSYLSAFDSSINARAEWLALIDLLTVKETRFFRQPAAYDCMADYVESLVSRGPVPSELSFWSAGCSNGHELYSMAMVMKFVLARHQPRLQWHGIGTDISFNAVSEAQQATYRESAIRSIPQQYRDLYMEKNAAQDWRVSDSIRARTHFFHSNLLHVNSAPFADFNIIFCQNVLIYFEREKQRWIIDQLVDRLRTGGLLILGAGEDVRWLNNNMSRLQWPGVCAYKKTGG